MTDYKECGASSRGGIFHFLATWIRWCWPVGLRPRWNFAHVKSWPVCAPVRQRSQVRVRRPRARPKPWLGGRLCGDLRLRFGRLSGRHTINAFGPGLLRYQGQAELLAHHTRKEAADRVLLPARRLHNSGDRCPLGLPKQGEDGLLLGPAAGRNPREWSQASQAVSRGSWRA